MGKLTHVRDICQLVPQFSARQKQRLSEQAVEPAENRETL